MNLGEILIWCKRRLYFGTVRNLVQMADLEMTLAGHYARVLKLTSAATLTYQIRDVSIEMYRSEHVPDSMPERPVVEDLISNLGADEVFFDLGANRGIYTCVVGRRLERGRVVAFEPNSTAANGLAANLRLNGLEHMVDLYRVAVSDVTGKREFFLQRGSTGDSLQNSRRGTATDTIEVPVVALDEFIQARSLPAPNVVKIDVEGTEWYALNGMRQALESEACRLVYCEIHEKAMESINPSMITDLLGHLGFHVGVIFERDENHYILRASK